MNTKINFTAQHYQQLKELVINFLFDGRTINAYNVGQSYNIWDLMHLCSINTLNYIRTKLEESIIKESNQDEWIADISYQSKIEQLKQDRELINLLIGYKRFSIQQSNIESQINYVKEQINKMKESTKTPEDKLKEMENKLKELEEF